MKNTSLSCIALAAALSLAGCGSPSSAGSVGAEGTASSSASATAARSATPSATPSAIPSATSVPTPSAPPAATPAATAAPTPSSAPDPEPSPSLFTTSDGLYSFVMPATWTATPVPPNTAPDYGANLSRTAYSIRDAAGTEMALFMGGIPGDGAAIPHPGHVLLDSEELPALSGQVDRGPGPISYVFDYFPDPVSGDLVYVARLHQGPLPADGIYAMQFTLASIGTNGQVAFTATFDQTRFPEPADATAWLGTEEYAGLRSMLSSLTFNG